MLGISVVAGWCGGGAANPTGAIGATIAAGVGFLAQAAWMAWKSGKGGASALATESVIGSACASFVLLSGGIRTVVAGLVVGFCAATAMAFRNAGSDRGGRVALSAWTAHLAGASAMAGIAVWIASVAAPSSVLPVLGLGLAGSYVAGVLLVRTLRSGQNTSTLPLFAWSVVSVCAWVVVSGGVPSLAAWMAWIPVPLRIAAVPGLRKGKAGWRMLGVLETLLAIWTLVWTLGAART